MAILAGLMCARHAMMSLELVGLTSSPTSEVLPMPRSEPQVPASLSWEPGKLALILICRVIDFLHTRGPLVKGRE